MWVAPGTNPRWPDGRQDDTHFNVRGARAVARMIAAQLPELIPELGRRLKASDFVVAQDGSGDFLSLAEAVAAVPDFCRDTTRILVCEGTYREKIVVPATKRNVVLEGRGEVKLTWDDYAAKTGPTGRPLGTSGSSTVYFGGDGWTVRNIAFENAAGRVGQAVAVQCLGTGLHFIGCRFLGNQDTLYLYGVGNRGECPYPFRRLLRRGDDRFHFRLGCGVVPPLRNPFESRFLHHGGLDLPGTGLRADLREVPPDRRRGRHALLAGASVARSCADGLHRLRNGCAYPARRVARLVETACAENGLLCRICLRRPRRRTPQPRRMVAAAHRKRGPAGACSL